MSIDEISGVETVPEHELPDYLPPDPAQFYAAGVDALPPAAVVPDEQQVLERLGPPPFPKGKFPFVGFLAGVYEHVSQRAASRVNDVAEIVIETSAEAEAQSETGEILPIAE